MSIKKPRQTQHLYIYADIFITNIEISLGIGTTGYIDYFLNTLELNVQICKSGCTELLWTHALLGRVKIAQDIAMSVNTIIHTKTDTIKKNYEDKIYC